MASNPRYELVDMIAQGDFATVYRARDRELGREVAIKQIHQQFLHDERQLARYWQEAQLLASLQHPNILTIYDIARSRGWLILELMRGSLKQVAQHEPLDLDFLRVVLANALNALHFLHGNGIIHGDIKPSNLLLDPQNRVKLGDFGLARRAASEEGSLLKGTTKYMAPELVSQQFGPVGPASDLYSLGFSAYELMCGPQFETLFPTLHTFGRDKQIAWMMWHAAADRHLPEISRVLQGVPPDLTRVIQRMVAKDPRQRYATAAEALRDLRADMLASTMLEEKKAPPPPPPKRRRWLAIGAVTLSLLVTAALVLLPGEKKTRTAATVEPTRGILRDVLPDEQRIVLELKGDGKRREIPLKSRDRIFINRHETQVLRDLKAGDRVTLRLIRDDMGRQITEVHAFRPETRRGRIVALKPDEGRFTLQPEGAEQAKNIDVNVPTNVKIVLNGRDTWQNKPVTLDKLKLDDQVAADIIVEETGNVATELKVIRPELLPSLAVVRNVDTDRREITFALGEGETPELVVLPYTLETEVTINGRRLIDQQLLRPTDLRPGDKAHQVRHDTKLLRVDVDRVLGQVGVVQRIEYQGRLLDVMMEGAAKPTTFTAKQSKITLAGEPAELSDLRAADVVDITHESIGTENPEAKTISARRPSDPQRWAIVVANQDFEDAFVSRLAAPVSDAKLLAETLTKRYAVPPDQLLLLADESLVRLEQGIANLLQRTTPESQVLIYVAGHAFKADNGEIYLAPKSFDFRRMETTGLALQWLAEQFEKCPAKDKWLLLDCTNPGDTADLRSEPSTAEMIQSLKPAVPGFPALRTVTAIASCRKGQRGLVIGGEHSAFATALARGLSGQADKNRDNRLEVTELFGFLTTTLPEIAQGGDAPPTPQLFLPDDRPPRLSDDAKRAIRKLAAYVRQDRVDPTKVQPDYDAATEAADKEVEPKILFGLIQLKTRQTKHRDEAFKNFQEVLVERPEQLVPAEGMAWIQFERSAYQAGIDELVALVGRLKPPKAPTDPQPAPRQRLFFWIGQLREYAATAALEGRRPSEASLKALDTAVARHGPDAERSYQQGRAKTRDTALDFDKRASSAEDKAAALRLNIERRQLVNYASFPFEEAMQSIVAGLEQ